ncbi:hypothetical protein HCBG_04790 [Histoplasma capsulatum G186AR]|uniref:Uncharacterized protein n=1 Tax=Ajellomyces capsulatus (strain G186AR / H82 / ATCC MYA-2454 / RMSCC 2432) TaxID=447093 RepID=C0NNR0_AJECG|nr:uncharacterized protein HCBG_04790 [Histoplasma capsulatum G186AR]EEH06570.1 hypothetical protein HCBG_04790 [Histoplasma capsulatum G186AR]
MGGTPGRSEANPKCLLGVGNVNPSQTTECKNAPNDGTYKDRLEPHYSLTMNGHTSGQKWMHSSMS